MSRRESRSRKRTSPVKVFIIVFVILVIVFTAGRFLIEKYGLLGILGGDVMKDLSPLAGGDSAFSAEFSDSKRVNVLLLGTNEDLSDTIMVMSFDTELKRVDGISIPRDTYYDRPDYDSPALRKINSVFKTEGFVGAATAVSNVLGGVPIHSYARITDEGVAAIVDAMGGIDIYVPMNMDYEDPGQDLYIHLQEGQQTLNGDQAVQFLRFRSGYPTADLGRIDAQQEFMRQAFKQSIGFGFPKVVSTAMKEVETDLKKTVALKLGAKAVGMDAEDFQMWTIPGAPKTIDGSSYFYADEAGTLEMMRQIYSMTAEPDEGN